MRRCLHYLQPLTAKFQKAARDIVHAYGEIGIVTKSIQGLRTNIEEVFKEAWWGEVVSVAENFNTILVRPRQAGRQTLRENHPADSEEDYFRISIAVPFLDHLSTQMADRLKNAELAKDGHCSR